MEITGILVKQTSMNQGVSKQSGNPWKIAEYLLEVPGQYPRHVNFKVSDGQVGRLARFDSLIGKNVTVSFDIDAHEYKDRWFNEISAWGVVEYIDQTTRQANIAAAQQQQDKAADETQTTGDKQGDGNDDLPF